LVRESSAVVFEKLRSGGLEGLLDRDVDVEVFYVLCTFIIKSRSVLLRMRNVPDKI